MGMRRKPRAIPLVCARQRTRQFPLRPYTLYRGVSGRGRARHVKGYAWSRSLRVAGFFAQRPGLEDPAVFRATIPDVWVLAYFGLKEGGQEEEFVVLLPATARPKRVPAFTWRAAVKIGEKRGVKR